MLIVTVNNCFSRTNKIVVNLERQTQSKVDCFMIQIKFQFQNECVHYFDFGINECDEYVSKYIKKIIFSKSLFTLNAPFNGFVSTVN